MRYVAPRSTMIHTFETPLGVRATVPVMPSFTLSGSP